MDYREKSFKKSVKNLNEKEEINLDRFIFDALDMLSKKSSDEEEVDYSELLNTELRVEPRTEDGSSGNVAPEEPPVSVTPPVQPPADKESPGASNYQTNVAIDINNNQAERKPSNKIKAKIEQLSKEGEIKVKVLTEAEIKRTPKETTSKEVERPAKNYSFSNFEKEVSLVFPTNRLDKETLVGKLKYFEEVMGLKIKVPDSHFFSDGKSHSHNEIYKFSERGILTYIYLLYLFFTHKYVSSITYGRNNIRNLFLKYGMLDFSPENVSNKDTNWIDYADSISDLLPFGETEYIGSKIFSLLFSKDETALEKVFITTEPGSSGASFIGFYLDYIQSEISAFGTTNLFTRGNIVITGSDYKASIRRIRSLATTGEAVSNMLLIFRIDQNNFVRLRVRASTYEELGEFNIPEDNTDKNYYTVVENLEGEEKYIIVYDLTSNHFTDITNKGFDVEASENSEYVYSIEEGISIFFPSVERILLERPTETDPSLNIKMQEYGIKVGEDALEESGEVTRSVISLMEKYDLREEDYYKDNLLLIKNDSYLLKSFFKDKQYLKSIIKKRLGYSSDAWEFSDTNFNIINANQTPNGDIGGPFNYFELIFSSSQNMTFRDIAHIVDGENLHELKNDYSKFFSLIETNPYKTSRYFDKGKAKHFILFPARNDDSSDYIYRYYFIHHYSNIINFGTNGFLTDEQNSILPINFLMTSIYSKYLERKWYQNTREQFYRSSRSNLLSNEMDVLYFLHEGTYYSFRLEKTEDALFYTTEETNSGFNKVELTVEGNSGSIVTSDSSKVVLSTILENYNNSESLSYGIGSSARISLANLLDLEETDIYEIPFDLNVGQSQREKETKVKSNQIYFEKEK